jgi:hypothetical protein|tara:strand:- start:5721 stop:6110 length:390 start_codon:yes stop_codon:yes gene_type:complete
MNKKTDVKANASTEELSKVEMEKKRAEITAYYKASLSHLQVQLEYEVALKDIEVARAERIQSQMFIAQAMAEPEEAPQPQRQAPPPQRAQAPAPQQAAAGPLVGNAGSDWDVDSKSAPPRRRSLKTVED